LSSNKPKTRLAILASGRGSNFSAIHAAVRQNQIPHAQIVGLVCNKTGAPVLSLAQQFGIPSVLIESKGRPPADYERMLLTELHRLAPDLVCLAGYMKILGDGIISAFENRILNIHPSLLPQFRGLNAQKQALVSGATETGCTVHWVTRNLDDGPIVAQAKLAIQPGDTETTLTERLLRLEHQTYVRALAQVVGQLQAKSAE
jgi:phosphoribosylglycinamide formyltransferase 1